MTNDESLRQALRWSAVGELSSRVAHESNNLLAGILGQAELGLLSNDPTRMKASLESIVKSSRELKAVTERLMLFTKLVEPSTQNTNLLEIFRTIFGMMERSFTKAGIVVERHYGNLPMTWCDPGGASPPLLYMLRFSLETLRAAGGGAIRLEASAEESEVVFRVVATPPDGARAEEIASRAGDLTLDQARGFAEREGGAFAMERRGPGFAMTCRYPIRRDPAAKERPQAASEAPASVPEIGSGASLRVLVIEDEKPIRDLFQEVLEASGCRVHCEPDGPAAIKAFDKERFDVVFTDLSLPGMDGFEVAGRLRARKQDVVLILMTGQATQESVRQGLEDGAAMVLHKPFELGELRAVLGSLRSDPTGRSLKEAFRTAGAMGGVR